jgi:hypothetical protein
MIINLKHEEHKVQWLTSHDDKGVMYWFSGNVQIKQDATRMWRVIIDGAWLPRRYASAVAAKLGATMLSK